MISTVYAAAARYRRRYYAIHPELRRKLSRPVISIGNLAVGGRAKTPLAGLVAARLRAMGERPAILSRGYGRGDRTDGVVVVSDGTAIKASIEQSGDEPLMLARQVPRAVVCVCPDRHLAGTLAERQLGCTVHILDDGFQHIELARHLDILVTTIGEIPNGRVIPMGRLREPADAAARAHFLVVSDATSGAASVEAWNLGIQQSCGCLRILGEPVSLGNHIEAGFSRPVRNSKILAVAGVAHPDRFFSMLRDAGWNVVESMAFADHHRYTAHDLAAIEAKLKTSGGDVVLTTDKDAVRLESFTSLPCPIHRVPLVVQFDPPDSLFASVMAVAAAGADGAEFPR